MNAVGKAYRLKSGYSIRKMSCYDGYDIRYFWTIWSPEGNHYINCGSYEEAYELASNLR